MPDNGIMVCPSVDHKRSMIGINPEIGIIATTDENDLVILEGSNQDLLYLAEKILELIRE